jgi:hypothetical protein
MTTEYGVWLHNSKLNTYHTMGICRHHQLQEMLCGVSFKKNTGYVSSRNTCLQCNYDYRCGVRKGNIPGCSNYTGIYIAEGVLKKAFDVMIKAHSGAAYDFICGHGMKVDSKCSVKHTNGTWYFQIAKNTIPDMFCLIALDNTVDDVGTDPKPLYVWLVPGNDINMKVSIGISTRSMYKFDQYRRTDMEGKIIKCCEKNS